MPNPTPMPTIAGLRPRADRYRGAAMSANQTAKAPNPATHTSRAGSPEIGIKIANTSEVAPKAIPHQASSRAQTSRSMCPPPLIGR